MYRRRSVFVSVLFIFLLVLVVISVVMIPRPAQASSYLSLHHSSHAFYQRGKSLRYFMNSSTCASNAICGYHGSFENIIYAAVPYAVSFSCYPKSSPNNDDADQAINVASHEQMEAATNPLGNGWFDASGDEIGDKCAWTFGPLNGIGADVTWSGNQYIVQNEFNNALQSCLLASGLSASTGGSTLFALSSARDGVWQYNGGAMNWSQAGGPASVIYGASYGLFATGPSPTPGNLMQYNNPMNWSQVDGPGLAHFR